jgi:hypothetical protein
MGYTVGERKAAQENKRLTRISIAIFEELLLLTGESPKTLIAYLNAIEPQLIAVELANKTKLESEYLKIPSPAALYREFSDFITEQKELEKSLGVENHSLRIRLIEIGVKYDDKYKGEPLQLLCFYDTCSGYLHTERVTSSKSITESFIIERIETIQHEIGVPVGNVFITQRLLADISSQWTIQASQVLKVVQHSEPYKPFEYLLNNTRKQYLIEVGFHRQRVKNSLDKAVEKYEKTNAKKLNVIRDKFEPSTKQPAYLQQIKESQGFYQIPTQIMQWLIEDAKTEQVFSEKLLDYLVKLPLDTNSEKLSWADVTKMTGNLIERFGEEVAKDFEEHITVHNMVYSHCGEVSTDEVRLAYKQWLFSDQAIGTN